MNKEIKNIKFELSDDLISQVDSLVNNNEDKLLLAKLNEFHHADIAEIIEQLNFNQAT